MLHSAADYLVETYLIKHMFVSTCLEKVITENCPTKTCFIPGLCQLSRTGWHLSEACQPPGGTEETTGSREAVEQRLVQEILKRCVIKLNYLQWPVCDWTIITTIIIMYNLTFSVGCCTDTLIIRNERGIYNNDINWRSRYFFLYKEYIEYQM